MPSLPKIPVPKVIARGFDAALGGFAVGERAWRGDRWKAAGLAVAIFIPLLWKKRLGAMALAAGMALLSYYFADALHEHEVVTEPVGAEPVTPPSHASLN